MQGICTTVCVIRSIDETRGRSKTSPTQQVSITRKFSQSVGVVWYFCFWDRGENVTRICIHMCERRPNIDQRQRMCGTTQCVVVINDTIISCPPASAVSLSSCFLDSTTRSHCGSTLDSINQDLSSSVKAQLHHPRPHQQDTRLLHLQHHKHHHTRQPHGIRPSARLPRMLLCRQHPRDAANLLLSPTPGALGTLPNQLHAQSLSVSFLILFFPMLLASFFLASVCFMRMNWWRMMWVRRL